MFYNNRQNSHKQTVDDMLSRLRAEEQLAKLKQRQRQQQIFNAPKRLEQALNSVGNAGQNLQKVGNFLSNKSPFTWSKNLGGNATTLGQKLNDINNTYGLSRYGQGLGTLNRGLGVIGKGYNVYNDLRQGDYAGAGIDAADTGYSAYQLGNQLGSQAAAQAASQASSQAATQAATQAGAEAGAQLGAEAGAESTAATAGPPGWVVAAIIEAARNAKGALIDNPKENAQSLANDEVKKAIMHNTLQDNKNFSDNLSALSGNYESKDVDDSARAYGKEQKQKSVDDATNQQNASKYLTGESTGNMVQGLADTVKDKTGIGYYSKLAKWGNKGIKLANKLNAPVMIYDMITKAQNKALDKAVEEGNRSSRIAEQELNKKRQQFTNSEMENLSNVVQDNTFNNPNAQTDATNEIVNNIAEKQEEQNQLPNTTFINNLMDKFRKNSIQDNSTGYAADIDQQQVNDVLNNTTQQPVATTPQPATTPTPQDQQLNGSVNQIVDPNATDPNAQPQQPPQFGEQVYQTGGGGGKIAQFLDQVRQGYKDNTENTLGNTYFAPNQQKTFANRLGEVFGTGQRIASNPFIQGGIASAVNYANGGNFGQSALTGIEWARNKANSDRYEQMINGGNKRSFLGNYTVNDYNAKVNKDYKDQQLQNAADEFQWKQDEADRKFEEQKRINDLKLAIEREKLNNQIKYQQGLLSLKKQGLKNGGRSGYKGSTKYDPTQDPNFYDDYDMYEQIENIENDSEAYEQEIQDMLDAMYKGKTPGSAWNYYSKEQRANAKKEVDKILKERKRNFMKKYHINPMTQKGKKK